MSRSGNDPKLTRLDASLLNLIISINFELQSEVLMELCFVGRLRLFRQLDLNEATPKRWIWRTVHFLTFAQPAKKLTSKCSKVIILLINSFNSAHKELGRSSRSVHLTDIKILEWLTIRLKLPPALERFSAIECTFQKKHYF